MSKINENVSKLVRATGISQRNLATISGISRRTIGRMIEAATTESDYTPTGLTAARLAETLGVEDSKVHERMTKAELKAGLDL